MRIGNFGKSAGHGAHGPGQTKTCRAVPGITNHPTSWETAVPALPYHSLKFLVD
ncbi:MAG: hypothetical protein KC419_12040 [Anaerolineales bacterium]|nr:hypothetical protein [Anaerolineales bacterium]